LYCSLQYNAKATLIQPTNSKPLPIEIELSTRHPCFTCSDCSRSSQPVCSSAAAAAAAVEEEEEAEIQLCPVHVCAVYEMRANDVRNITKVWTKDSGVKKPLQSMYFHNIYFTALFHPGITRSDADMYALWRCYLIAALFRHSSQC
jgi:hypothetical protein